MNAGEELGPYQIKEQLGAGGMGEVYRARDPRLDRDVAIKVLPKDFAADPERLARFEREAKLLAQLNHANIASIYGLEDAGGVRFIAMECVEGETLAERLAAGPVESDDALEIARQIAEALEAAHEAGIVHRDLKPANVKVTAGGKVKVLDFGLAKAWDVSAASGSAAGPDTGHDMSHSPTMMHATRTGVILGTAAYMSPEQARGKAVDKRADIWAFGCVLFEMLAGRRAFGGETVSDTMAAILKEEPDWTLLPAGVSRAVSRVLLRCLQKDPHQRLHDIADARIEITAANDAAPFDEPVAQSGAKASFVRFAPFVWGAVGLAVGALAAAQLWAPAPQSDPETTPVPRRLSIALPEAEAMSGGPNVLGSEQRLFDLSPDGRFVAYAGAWNETTRLYLRGLDDFEVTPIPGTEGGYHPFFSPDGEWVGFIDGNLVKKVRLSGGTPETITSGNQLWGAAWSADGWVYVLVSEGRTLARAPESGGEAEVLFQFSERHAELPAGLPNFGARALQPAEGGAGLIISMWGMSLSADAGFIVLYSPSDDRITLLQERGYEGRYSTTGHLLFVRGNALFAAPMDLDTLTVEDAGDPIVQNIRGNSSHGSADFDVASDGALVYVAGGDHAVSVPVWVDFEGNVEPLPLPAQRYGTFRLSPDGNRLAMVVAEANDNIYVYDLERSGTVEPVTVTGANTSPVWSRDGEWLAFASTREGRHRIYRKWIDGRPEEILFEDELQYVPYSFSPDGELLLVSRLADGQVTAIALGKDREPAVVTDLQYPGWGPMFSPDGEWIGVTSEQAGVYNVYLRRYPSTGGAINVSGTGGEEPVFSPDGSRVFYRWGSDWFAVDLGREADASPSLPRQLFRRPFINVPWLSYVASPDGERLLVLDPVVDRAPVNELRVVLDWPDETRR